MTDDSQTLSIAVEATALTIAGSDPSGGAGLQADLKTFQQLGVYGMSVISLITVQNTVNVFKVEVLPAELVLQQLEAVLDDIFPSVIKIGALGEADVVRGVAERLKQVDCSIVVDPVLVSKHGQSLVNDDVVAAYREHLLPLATWLTPNRHEAQKLTGIEFEKDDDIFDAITCMHMDGAEKILIKCGNDDGQSSHLFSDRIKEECTEIKGDWLDAENTHGSGCVLSATIAGAIALGAVDPDEIVKIAIARTFEAISIGCNLGKGIHPVDVRGLRKFT